MNKLKIFLLAVIGLCALTAAAQTVTITRQVRLTNHINGPAFFPTLSPDGSRLLYSGGNPQQLHLLDLTDNHDTVVNDDGATAFDALFGGDGKVYYISTERHDNNLLYRSGHCYNPATGTTEQVLAPQHGAVALERATAGVALHGGTARYASARQLGTAVRTEQSTVIVTVNGRERSFSPVPSWAGYCWASLSPDARRVAFFAAGTGIIVIDLNGNVLATLGNYEMPSWLNNDYIVAQNTTDDGHQFLRSQLMLLKADGSFRYELTKPTSMTMQPSAANGRIAYTTIDGLLQFMDIIISQ